MTMIRRLTLKDGKQQASHLELRSHRNAFGFLRLMLASLVIVSHTPELVDGNRTREVLTRCFGTVSFGELSVDGFFIISGLLISKSYLSSRSALQYLIKRLMRIYPAFITCCLICATVVASAGGANNATLGYRTFHAFTRSLLLHSPEHYGAFAGSYYQDLNGAAWTIPYEFRCYILIMIVGYTGLLRNRFLLLFLSLACLIGAVFLPNNLAEAMNTDWHLHTALWLGDPIQALRLTGMFLAGATFQIYQNRAAFSPRLMAVSGMALAMSLYSPIVADFGIATLGTYLLFGAAALGKETIFAKINSRNDISYGLYLYAWPTEKLLIMAGLGFSLSLLAATTWAISLMLGSLSWFLVERPVMRTIRRIEFLQN